MAASLARRKANLENAQRSTGPSESGKIRSRANSLKHGLTGQGVVLPESDADRIAKRLESLTLEMQPSCERGRFLVGQIAMLMVRIDRAVEQENASNAMRMRHAADAFDHQRIEAVDELETLLGSDPVPVVRLLRGTPEGVTRMLELWDDLRERLIDTDPTLWSLDQADQADNLTGRKLESRGLSRIRKLTCGTLGDFEGLGDLDDPTLDDDSRRVWARDLLLEVIDAEVAELEGMLPTFDYDRIAQDRASARDRSYFDSSHEATQARKYAAANNRLLAQARKEFKDIQAQAQPWALVQAMAARSEVSGSPNLPKSPLGSFWQKADRATRPPVPAEPEPAPEPSTPTSNPVSAISDPPSADSPPR